MADFNTPINTTGYSDVLANLKARDVDAITLCVSVPTNIPAGAIQYNRAGDKFQEYSGSTWIDQLIAIAGGGTGAANAADARTNLGLGSMATQASNSVSITGGSIAGASLNATDISAGTLALARGGTGASLSAGTEGQVLGMSSGAVAFLSLASAFPAGGIIQYGAAAAPTGWILCDGSAIDRSIYATLFSVIGTTYGVGNGTTTFNVPNLKQRFPLGKADSGTGAALGATGGAIDHTHTGPAHAHTGPSHTHSVGNHVHSVFGYTDATPVGTENVGAPGGGTLVASTTHYHSFGASTNYAGDGNTGAEGSGATSTDGTGATGTNNPPFLVVNYIIKH